MSVSVVYIIYVVLKAEAADPIDCIPHKYIFTELKTRTTVTVFSRNLGLPLPSTMGPEIPTTDGRDIAVLLVGLI